MATAIIDSKTRVVVNMITLREDSRWSPPEGKEVSPVQDGAKVGATLLPDNTWDYTTLPPPPSRPDYSARDLAELEAMLVAKGSPLRALAEIVFEENNTLRAALGLNARTPSQFKSALKAKMDAARE